MAGFSKLYLDGFYYVFKSHINAGGVIIIQFGAGIESLFREKIGRIKKI